VALFPRLQQIVRRDKAGFTQLARSVARFRDSYDAGRYAAADKGFFADLASRSLKCNALHSCFKKRWYGCDQLHRR